MDHQTQLATGTEEGIAMNAHSERAAREAEIWDNQLLERQGYESMLEHANSGPAKLRRNRFVSTAVADLGDKTVLEIGSQAWAPVLKKNGVHPKALTCINISHTEAEKGRVQAEEVGFKADFRIMDGNKLEFPDGYFDFIYGVAILHHLDFETALREIHRVLKPGGRLLFVEPLRLNPVAQLVRLLTPKARTADERPLGRKELKTVEKYFSTENLFTELFYVPAAILSRFILKTPVNRLTKSADAVDKALVSVLPSLGLFYRTVTIYGRRRNGA